MSISISVPEEFRFPYPGLRPFQRNESQIFFGRCVQIDQMLAKLEERRFLAVVGASGSGKSSLVRAGLLPALKDGFLAGTSEIWRIVAMRPGDQPYARLAQSFRKAMTDQPPSPQDIAFLQASLRTGPLGLAEAVRDARLPDGASVLLLVDQFEELFRYRHRHLVPGDPRQADRNKVDIEDWHNAASSFVNLLVASAEQSSVPIYVVLTMRTDFLGDCDVFRGLPEAINDSQFLTPRLTRDQLRETITGPLQIFDADAEPALINRILNDVGSDPDQLPLMQHALMQTWLHSDNQNFADGDFTRTLRLSNYEQVGGLEHALSNHADEAWMDLQGPTEQRVAELMFRSLCDPSMEGRLTRRLVTVREVAEVAGVSTDTVCHVADAFLRPDRSFLVTTPSGPLTPKTTIDISHEALIRQWERLEKWVEHESESAAIYRRLAEQARLWDQGKASLWRPPELDIALDWQQREQPTSAWAHRYDCEFDLSLKFLKASEDERQREQLQQRRKRALWNRVLIAVLALSAVIGMVILTLWRKAEFARQEADMARSATEDNLITSEFLVGASRIAQGQISEGVHAYWNALSLAKADDPRRTNGLNLIASWCRRLGERLQLDAPVSHVVYSSDGSRIFTVGLDRTVLVWDAGKREPIQKPLVHPHRISDIAISPDDQTVLTGCWDNIARLWDLETGNLIGQPMQHEDPVAEVAFSPSGTIAATSSSDGKLRLWDAKTGRPLGQPLTATGGKLHPGFAFSPDGQVLVGTEDEALILWNTETRQIRKRVDFPRSRRCVAFSSDGKQILSGDDSGVVTVIDASSGDTVWSAPEPGRTLAGVTRVAFSSDNRTAVAVYGDGSARLWDVAEGKTIGGRLRHQSAIISVAFGPRNELLVTGGRDNVARLWSVATGEPVGAPLQHEATVSSVTFSPRGGLVLTGSWNNCARIWTVENWQTHGKPVDINASSPAIYSPDGTMLAMFQRHQSGMKALRIWDAETGQPTGPGLLDVVESAIAFSPDSRRLAVLLSNHAIAFLDCSTGQPLDIAPEQIPGGISLAYAPSGNSIVVGYQDGTARLWDTQSGKPLAVALKTGGERVSVVAYSPDSQYVATGNDDGMAQIWDASSGTRLTNPLEHQDVVTSVAYSPDGSKLLTSSADGTARLWNANTGEPIGTHLRHQESVMAVAFSPSGSLVMTGSADNSARIWHADTGLPTRAETMYHRAAVTRVSFSPDSRTVLTGSRDGTAAAWDAVSGQPRSGRLPHEGEIVSAAFSPDGRRVLSASSHGPPRIWNVVAPAKDDAQRLKLSVEVRTGYHNTDTGSRRMLTQAKWLAQKRKLETLGGPCDVRDWDDLSADELKQMPVVPFPFFAPQP